MIITAARAITILAVISSLAMVAGFLINTGARDAEDRQRDEDRRAADEISEAIRNENVDPTVPDDLLCRLLELAGSAANDIAVPEGLDCDDL